VLAGDRKGGPAWVHRLMSARPLPQPAYRLDDGTEWAAADYFTLLDAAGSADALPDWFRWCR
jgi:hypothetical protein